ncbi:hypothetical protein [Streptomyces sp. NBC_01506]
MPDLKYQSDGGADLVRTIVIESEIVVVDDEGNESSYDPSLI